MSFSENKAYAVEWPYIYFINNDRGLVKVQCSGTNYPGKIVKINQEAKG